MNSIVIYIPEVNSRLRYVLDWLFKEQLKTGYTIISDEKDVTGIPFFISYGRPFPNALNISATGLLAEQGIQEHKIKTGTWHNIPVLYGTPDGDIPFDLFSALFFLLSRYEEYYSFTPDKHNRYPATQSILYKNGWLQRPLLDEWVYEFRNLLQEKYKQQLSSKTFSYQPTYDIDIAWSFRHKGFFRTTGAYLKYLLSGNFSAITDRTSVLLNKKKDPYDSFDWLAHLHKVNNCTPFFFILASLRTTAFDKNISPRDPEMQRLIKQLASEGTVGIHPSYYTNTGNGLENEKNTLERITGITILASRQHYIKLVLPDTYYLLLKNNIHADYSMGYGTHLGFRAGTGQSFLWYDLEKEQETPLRIYPFCFMDTTALYEEHLSVAAAFEKLNLMTQRLKDTNSLLITVFHNFSLGTAKEWIGWKEAYEQFISQYL